MAYKLSGRVLTIGPLQNMVSKSGTNYMKQDLVVTLRKFDPYTGEPTDDPDNTPKFTFFGEKCKDLAPLRIGDVVTISFEVTGRGYEKDGHREYFTEVRPLWISQHKMQEQSFNNQAFQGVFPAYNPSTNTSTSPEVQNAFTEAPTAIPKSDDLPF